MTGTQGWSQVVVQAEFDWTGTPDGLFSVVSKRLHALEWNSVSVKPGSKAIWSNQLTNGSTAKVALTPGALGEPHWEFVAPLAPPVGKGASGC